MRKENVVNKKSLSSPNVSIGDLQRTRRFVMKQQTTCVEDSRLRPSGMTGLFYHGNNAFTLIELLVVVLIIGILAAVALPQYQKAVEKSKATQALTLLKSVAQAGTAHHIASGSYATKFDELDIDIPWTGTTKGYTDYQATDTLSNNDWSIQLYNENDGTQNCIYVTRLTGKYKGAVFNWCWKNPSGQLQNIISCAERKSGGVVFSGQVGDYCQKVMRGTKVLSNASVTLYTLPF